MWFYETLHPDVRLALNGKQIRKKKTAYQACRIYKTSCFGRVLLLDGAIQTTEKDEFIYHEMLTHPLFLTHPKPKDILLIGAGDGGILREIFKYRSVKRVVMVEIDKDVIAFSRKYLPFLSKGAFGDKRLELVIEDGAKYVARTKEKFDIVIIDSPDPVGPAKILFSRKFYKNIFSLLKEKGLMIRQTGSIMLQLQVLKGNYRRLKEVFPYVTGQLAAVPTYIGGFFSFLIAAKGMNFKKASYRSVAAKFNKLKLSTKYYNPDIHFASQKMPNYLKEIAE